MDHGLKRGSESLQDRGLSVEAMLQDRDFANATTIFNELRENRAIVPFTAKIPQPFHGLYLHSFYTSFKVYFSK